MQPFVLILVAIPLIAWCFHGSSRIWQQYCIFDAVNTYKVFLFDRVTKLNMQWHQDNHSGSVIDRVNKATNALQQF